MSQKKTIVLFPLIEPYNACGASIMTDQYFQLYVKYI